MKFCLHFVMLFALLLRSNLCADVVHLTNGRAVNCEVIKWDETSATIRYSVPNSLGGAGTPAERAVPWTEISSVDFAPVAAELETLRKAAAADNAEMLLELWGKKKLLLGKANSNAGDIGMAYADLLATKSDAPRQERALGAYQLIAEQDWNPTRRGLAVLGRLKLWLRQGRPTEADEGARKMLNDTEDPAILLDAHQVIGGAAQSKLNALEKEHPKWDEEDDIKPQRMEMYRAARDALLYPLLFQGADEVRAAKSLWQLVQFMDSHGEAAEASVYARDIVKLYPKMAEAELAQKWLEKQKS